MSRLILILLVSTTMIGCQSSLLVIRHQDPTQPVAEVRIDGVDQGSLNYGEELELRVKPGQHELSLTTPGSDTNAWSDDQKPVGFVMDERCVVTLMTPPSRAQSSMDEESSATDTEEKQ